MARCTVARLMRPLGLRGIIRGKSVRTTLSDEAAPCPLDRVNRNFKAPAPNRLWVSDFTYVATWAGASPSSLSALPLDHEAKASTLANCPECGVQLKAGHSAML